MKATLNRAIDAYASVPVKKLFIHAGRRWIHPSGGPVRGWLGQPGIDKLHGFCTYVLAIVVPVGFAAFLLNRIKLDSDRLSEIPR